MMLVFLSSKRKEKLVIDASVAGGILEGVKIKQLQ